MISCLRNTGSKEDLRQFITIYSAYMRDIMALMGRHDRKISMAGIAQENQTVADTAKEKKGIQKNSYHSYVAE